MEINKRNIINIIHDINCVENKEITVYSHQI